MVFWSHCEMEYLGWDAKLKCSEIKKLLRKPTKLKWRENFRQQYSPKISTLQVTSHIITAMNQLCCPNVTALTTTKNMTIRNRRFFKKGLAYFALAYQWPTVLIIIIWNFPKFLHRFHSSQVKQKVISSTRVNERLKFRILVKKEILCHTTLQSPKQD